MADTWYLRTQDETYGPETRERLLEWARMGRIQPGQEVSCDGAVWSPATEVPFLDMRWSIDIGDGTPRGPFNKHAAQALLASGRLPPGSKLIEVREPFTTPPPAPEPEPEPEPEPQQEPGPTSEPEPVPEPEPAPLRLESEPATEAGRLADIQNALYALMRDEADEIAAAMDRETREFDELRRLNTERCNRLLARRQELLRRIGADAQDMTRRALRANPDDPRSAHLRQEVEALRLLQEKSALESERRIRDLSAKLRERETEANRLRQQLSDVTVLYRQLQEARERLQMREKELMEERQRAEAERQQHAAAQQTLLARLSALEMGLPGATNQSREARSVRLAPWMGLKR